MRGLPYLCLLALGACAGARLIPNTRVPDTSTNREIIDVCERYRHAVEAHDAMTVMALASPNYFNDSGTQKADDDYGYDGLKKLIEERFARLKSVRYEMEYRHVNVNGPHAEVEVYIDASFQLSTGALDQFKHVTEFNKFELEHDGKRWLFTRGM